MHKYFTLLLLLILFSCSEKDAEYWTNPINQNGNLNGFYASSEYCELLKKKSQESNELKNIETKIYEIWDFNTTSQSVSKQDSLTNYTLNEIEYIYNELVSTCGGYCISNQPYLPVLPYRYAEAQQFWSQKHLLPLASTIDIYFKEYEKLMRKVDNTTLKSMFKLISELPKSNTIDSMLSLRKMQVLILEINNKNEC